VASVEIGEMGLWLKLWVWLLERLLRAPSPPDGAVFELAAPMLFSVPAMDRYEVDDCENREAWRLG
jgi:hypothetical protein